MKGTSYLYASLATALLLLSSCGSTTSPSTTTDATSNAIDSATQSMAVSDAALQDAKTAYASYCSGCHGAALESFVDREWKHGSSDADLFKAIKHGYPNEGMPAFDQTFTDEEIKGLVAYIRKGVQEASAATGTDEEESESADQSFRLDTVVTGLGVPWGMAFLPNGDMLITERSGEFHRFTSKCQRKPSH